MKKVLFIILSALLTVAASGKNESQLHASLVDTKVGAPRLDDTAFAAPVYENYQPFQEDEVFASFPMLAGWDGGNFDEGEFGEFDQQLDPVPVGDGLLILLTLAGGYALRTRRKKH